MSYDTVILLRIRIIVGDAGFDPGTSDPRILCAITSQKYLGGEQPGLLALFLQFLADTVQLFLQSLLSCLDIHQKFACKPVPQLYSKQQNMSHPYLAGALLFFHT